MQNYHNKIYPYQNNEVITEGNFSQRLPTNVAVGITGLKIYGGNHINCIYPADTVITDGLFIKVEYCKNLHPDWLELPNEVENCDHVKEIIEVDGKVIGYIYEDKVL